MAVEKTTGSFVFAVYLFAAILSANYVSCQKNQWNGLLVRMIVVGKTGVGKSTLINNIFGKKLAEVGDGLELQTKTTEVLNKNINGTRVKICDTPGFRDGQDKDEEYSQEMTHRCSNPDVILFCIRMDETRWTDDYKATILGLTNALGKSIWNNTVLVLTFADKVDFDEIIKTEIQWKVKLSEQLILIGVDNEVADRIPIVMSGNSVDPVSSGFGNWLPKLFLRCLQVSKEGGKTALLTIVFHLIDKGYMTEDKRYFKEFIPQKGLWVRMLVVGKTGIGKSTLINNIFGKTLAQSGSKLESETKTVEVISDSINGTEVDICDTPGFRDGQDKDDEYMDVIIKNCSNPDVILFCIRMDETRWTDDYKATILGLTNALGKSIWNNTVLVLTFADKCYFNVTRELEWKEAFYKQLISIGVNEDVADRIPIVMSGNSVDPVSSGFGNWLPKLFLRCLQVSKEGGKTALLTIVFHLIDKGYMTEDKRYFKEFIPQKGLWVRMLVVGKTGIGKSTLINNIFGKTLAQSGSKLESETKTVEVISDSINGTEVDICDTPGFRDGQDKDDEYMDVIINNCSNPDVILFCIRMDETRWTDDYKATILGLTNALGKSIWSNTVLVLTFADKSYFNVTRKLEWKETFYEQLISIGVNEDVADRIPVVMTSDSVNTRVHNWLPKLFTACLRMSKEKGKAALVPISIYLIEEAYIEDEEGHFKEFLCDILHW